MDRIFDLGLLGAKEEEVAPGRAKPALLVEEREQARKAARFQEGG